jgi:iron complex transport system substrate-binding protein
MRFTCLIPVLAIVLLTESCNNRSSEDRVTVPYGNLITRAERFSLERIDDKLTILRLHNPWQGAGNVTMVYYLLDREAHIPEGIDTLLVIRVPVRKMVCMSATHTAMVSALGAENTLTGISGTGFIYSQSIRRRIEQGGIKDVGYESNLNNELILSMKPDLVMIYGIGSESAGYMGKIMETGIRVLINADYLETHPLGKAEWIKLFGALYCRESLADSIFRKEETDYETVKEIVSSGVSVKPAVLLGMPYRDTWYISPGNSYISTLISDAGGNYLWSDTESLISMPFGIESVYLKAVKADFWLNTGTAQSKEEILAVDHRLGDLPPFRNGMVFNNINRMNSNGGNDYWETGSVHPHLILKDIATILHPDIFGNDEPWFYRQIF